MEYNRLIFELSQLADELTDIESKQKLTEIIWDINKNGIEETE